MVDVHEGIVKGKLESPACQHRPTVSDGVMKYGGEF